MSNFMPLRQLIADLINTLLLAVLKVREGWLWGSKVGGAIEVVDFWRCG